MSLIVSMNHPEMARQVAFRAQNIAPQVAKADVSLPSGLVGTGILQGKLDALLETSYKSTRRVPVVVFLHGSSGLNDDIRRLLKWMAEDLSVASVAPDSFAVPGRTTYTSPTSKTIYEEIHALRESEIRLTLGVLSTLPWVDSNKLILAGTSEGAVSVARWRGSEFCGRIIYSWSCENNYFVDQARNGFGPQDEVLSILPSDDPYFGPRNEWNQDYEVKGYCAACAKVGHLHQIALIPNAPHALFNEPTARYLTAGFVCSLIGNKHG